MGQPQLYSAENGRGRVTHTPPPLRCSMATALGKRQSSEVESKPGVATIRDHSRELHAVVPDRGMEFTAVRIALCPVCVVVTKISTCENPQDCTPKKSDLLYAKF